ncbi:MAG TPA: response regulator transcription factor [Gaiellaceae bacterium]|nr:response regulator transcription factor [Gaiellaceae bacterium]
MATGRDEREGLDARHAPLVRVLVADPGDIARDAVARVLECDGRFEVCATASDAAGTVAGAVAEAPDICLIETGMPGGGLAAAWEVTSRLPDTRVVILTSRDSDEELLEALEVGVSGYLLKTAVLGWLPNTLMDVHRGTFALPRQLTHRIVRRLRTSEPRRRSIVGPGSRLTSREWEVLDLIAGGMSTRAVAEQLTLSPTAVRVHIASAVRKLGVESRSEAIELFTRSAAVGRAGA